MYYSDIITLCEHFRVVDRHEQNLSNVVVVGFRRRSIFILFSFWELVNDCSLFMSALSKAQVQIWTLLLATEKDLQQCLTLNIWNSITLFFFSGKFDVKFHLRTVLMSHSKFCRCFSHKNILRYTCWNYIKQLALGSLECFKFEMPYSSLRQW